MQKDRKDDSFIKSPIFVGGVKAMNAHIHLHLSYPKEALEHKIEGTVLVRFDIDYKGNVTDAKVMKGIGYGCDEEAIRIIKLMKFEVPKNPRKLKLIFHKNLQINFKLPVEKPEVITTVKPNPVGYNQVQIQYNVVLVKNSPTIETKTQPSTTYNYTIKMP